jgi:hypothetical protein
MVALAKLRAGAFGHFGGAEAVCLGRARRGDRLVLEEVVEEVHGDSFVYKVGRHGS